MKKKHYFPLIGFILLILVLKGCVYLRLLEVKFQLSEFEKYFRIEDQGGLDLRFLEPILIKDDILYLAKRGPTTVREFSQQSVWQYYFEKRVQGGDQEQADFHVPVNLYFKGEKLTMVTFPKKFIEILPREFLIESFRAIGLGEVKKTERHVSGNFRRNKNGDDLPIPSKTEFLKLLGIPTEEEHSSTASTLHYTYILKPAKPDAGIDLPQAWARFYFQNGTDRLIKAEAKFAGIKLSMTF